MRCDVGASAAPWSAIGLVLSADSVPTSSVHRGLVNDVELVLDPNASGFVSCTFATDAQVSTVSDVDGMPIHVASLSLEHADLIKPQQRIRTDSIPFEILGIDHVVVMTDDLARTSSAIEAALGVQCARIREAGKGVVQGFHKLDNTIIEIVTGPHVRTPGAHLWGFVITVDDLDAWYRYVGDDVASMPRDAVQPGRKIATIRESLGLGVAVAVMSPHVKPESV